MPLWRSTTKSTRYLIIMPMRSVSFCTWSKWRESNPHPQSGSLMYSPLYDTCTILRTYWCRLSMQLIFYDKSRCIHYCIIHSHRMSRVELDCIFHKYILIYWQLSTSHELDAHLVTELPWGDNRSQSSRLMELMTGIEPATSWLQISCSAYWATSAYGLSGEIRTLDPVSPGHVRYQLRYTQILFIRMI